MEGKTRKEKEKEEEEEEMVENPEAPRTKQGDPTATTLQGSRKEEEKLQP